MQGAITIERLNPKGATTAPLLAQAEEIFFATAARPYPDPHERAAFRERWFGRYLDHPSDVLLLALDGPSKVAGYLVGTLEDASTSARFADTAYFREAFAEACRAFPAHLHINMDERYRNQGIGERLIEGFARVCRSSGVRGMHVVTGRGMRNVRFYQRCGFIERASSPRNGGDMVFLGRAL